MGKSKPRSTRDNFDKFLKKRKRHGGGKQKSNCLGPENVYNMFKNKPTKRQLREMFKRFGKKSRNGKEEMDFDGFRLLQKDIKRSPEKYDFQDNILVSSEAATMQHEKFTKLDKDNNKVLDSKEFKKYANQLFQQDLSDKEISGIMREFGDGRQMDLAGFRNFLKDRKRSPDKYGGDTSSESKGWIASSPSQSKEETTIEARKRTRYNESRDDQVDSELSHIFNEFRAFMKERDRTRRSNHKSKRVSSPELTIVVRDDPRFRNEAHNDHRCPEQKDYAESQRMQDMYYQGYQDGYQDAYSYCNGNGFR